MRRVVSREEEKEEKEKSMGQRYIILNLTKKEFLVNSRGYWAKLAEYVADDKCTTALYLLLANSNDGSGGDIGDGENLQEWNGRWAGDKIVIQGEEADDQSPAFVTRRRLNTFTDITDPLYAALRQVNPWQIYGEVIEINDSE